MIPPKIEGGFVVLARILFEKSLWQLSPDHTRLAFYLLCRARSKHEPVRLPKGDTVARGQLVTSLAGLAEGCSYFDNRMQREWSRKKVSRLLSDLKEISFIAVKSHSKGTLITICNYGEYQDIDNYKSHSEETVRKHRGNSEEHQQEVNNVKNDSYCAEPEADSTPEEIVLTFPTTGNPKQWNLNKSKLGEYKAAYETLDVEAQCKRALQWVNDNPSKKKTSRGMSRFLGAWLARAADNPATPKQQTASDANTVKPPTRAQIAGMEAR